MKTAKFFVLLVLIVVCGVTLLQRRCLPNKPLRCSCPVCPECPATECPAPEPCISDNTATETAPRREQAAPEPARAPVSTVNWEPQRLPPGNGKKTNFKCYQSSDWAEICVYDLLCTDGQKVVLIDDSQPEGTPIHVDFGVGDDPVGYHVFDVFPRPPPKSKGMPLNTRGTGYYMSSKALETAVFSDRTMWLIFPETQTWEIQHIFFYSHIMFPIWEARESNETWGNVLPPIEDVYVMAQRRFKFNDWENSTLSVMLPPGGRQLFIDHLSEYSPTRLMCTRRGFVSGNKPFVFSGMKPAWNFRDAVYRKYGIETLKHPPKKLLVYNRANAGRRFENIDEMEALFKRYDIPYVIMAKVGNFSDQVKQMSQAGVLMLSHGAAATNTIFQQHRSVLIESFPYLRKRFGFMSIAQVIGNFYFPLFSWEKGWTGKTVMNETQFLDTCNELSSIYTNKYGVCDAAQKVVTIRAHIPTLERILIDAFDTIGYRIYDKTKQPAGELDLNQ